MLYLIESVTQEISKNGKSYLKAVVNDAKQRLTVYIWNLGAYDTKKLEGFIANLDVTESNGFYNAVLNPSTLITIDQTPEESPLRKIQFKGRYTSKDLYNLCSRLLSKTWKRILDVNKHLILDYEKFPAGAKVHHPWVNGLSTHTYEALRFAEKIMAAEAEMYDQKLDKDVVYFSIIFHDLGKMLEYKTTDFTYTRKMYLMGHVFMSASTVQQVLTPYAREGVITPNQVEMVVHCILAHHGVREYGSPVIPASLEAYYVHIADLLSARSDMFNRSFDMENNKWLDTTVCRIEASADQPVV